MSIAEKLRKLPKNNILQYAQASARLLDSERNFGFKKRLMAEGLLNDLEDEIAELREELVKGDKDGIFKETGDVLQAVVNMCHCMDVDAVDALQYSVDKLEQRFIFMEKYLEERGKKISSSSTDELDAAWREAKKSGIM